MNQKMNRKILSILLIQIMLLSSIGFSPVSYAAVGPDFAGGTGTAEDPWQIATALQLDNVRYYLGPENHDKHFILTADVDLDIYPFNAGEGWQPIGDWDSPDVYFYGNFDGGGKTIRNLFVDQSDSSIAIDPAGLFGEVMNATIKNLTLENVDVKGDQCVGGLAGDAECSFISDIHITGSVTGNDYTGGLAGFFYESYTDRTSFNGIVAGNYETGGLIGYQYRSSVRNSLSKGYVNGFCDTGGLVGKNYKSSIFDAHSESAVTGVYYDTEYPTEIGGLVGYNYSDSTINKSYATGAVTGTDHVGGLVGANVSYSKITDSYALGSVASDAEDTDKAVGGLLGNNTSSSTVTNCYAVGPVSGAGIDIGGLVGENQTNFNVISSYSLGPDNGQGTVVTSEQMQTESTFDGWDFTSIWIIDEGYPHLWPSGVAEIVSLEHAYVSEANGTSLDTINFPYVVRATLDDSSIVPLRVTWDVESANYDGYTSGDYLFTGKLDLVEGIENTGEYSPMLTVTVLPIPKEIIGVETFTDITVPIGTLFNQIPWPTSVTVTLDDNSTTSLAVEWYSPDESLYDGNTSGTYPCCGTISLVSGIKNTAEIFAAINIIVEIPPDKAPVIIGQPEDCSVKAGETATFAVEYEAKPDPSFQWQYSKNGGKKWNTIPGATASVLELAQASVETDGYLYRVILDNGIGAPVTSSVAKLSVAYGTADVMISQYDGLYDPATNEILWRITVTNNGPEAAQGIVVKNALASNTKLISVDGEYKYIVKGKTVTIDVGEMAPNRCTEVTIRVVVARAASSIENAAAVSSKSLDPDLTNNTSIVEALLQ